MFYYVYEKKIAWNIVRRNRNRSPSFDRDYVLFYGNTDPGSFIRSGMDDMPICHAEVLRKNFSLKSLCSRLSPFKFMLYNERNTNELPK